MKWTRTSRVTALLCLFMLGACGKKSAEGQSCAASEHCAGTMVCLEQKCCQPSCEGKECGSDGCDGICGNCPTGKQCTLHECTGPSWTDSSTGLGWQITPTGGEMIWKKAIEHCEGLPLEGGGWRLPSILELRSLIRGCADTDNYKPGCREKKGPANDGCYWPLQMEGDCGHYWSSTTVEDNQFNARDIRFVQGWLGWADKRQYSRNVRCVR